MTQTYKKFEARLREIAVPTSPGNYVLGLADVMRIAAIGVGTMSDSATSSIDTTIRSASSKVGDSSNEASVWKGTVASSGFKFGAGSEKELVGVSPMLVKVTRLALSYCTQDFVVYDGIRTHKEQAQYVANGTSKTMASKHLDGLAVDLVPYIGGKPVWDWDGCYRIALAMDRAATESLCASRIRWGGAWDRTLADFGGDPGSYQQEVESYRKRHAGSDFIDGPHFEWIK